MTEAERFEAFVREYQDMVFAVALRLLGRAADAEDIAQTVFLKAFERFAAIRDETAVAGWLKTVAINLSLNYLSRYRARWQFFSEMDGDHPRGDAGFIETIASPVSDVQEVADDAERTARLERALQALPDHQRVPLVLFHFEDASYQDIAARLGVSLGKVKTDIHRGREALRKELT